MTTFASIPAHDPLPTFPNTGNPQDTAFGFEPIDALDPLPSYDVSAVDSTFRIPNPFIPIKPLPLGGGGGGGGGGGTMGYPYG